MSVSNKKIVTLIPSATEIVAFLGEKKTIIGRSHECDYTKDLSKVVKLTSPKINIVFFILIRHTIRSIRFVRKKFNHYFYNFL